jgi:hypothetical protein
MSATMANPSSSRSVLLSRAAEDITFIRLRDGKRDVHRFPVDVVHVRLASDKTVHLSRPDGAAVFPHEPSGLLSKAVKQLRYRHEEDGEDYFHDFDPGVSLIVTGKRAHLYRPDGEPLWGRFD